MTGDAWNERRKALEDSFFMKRDQELLESLRQELAAEAQKKALTAASGIQDGQVLDQLIAADISSETLAAVSLVPVVLVAWADGEIADNERKAILAASEKEGISAATASHNLLRSWLEHAPDQSALTNAWKGYIGLVVQRLDGDARAQLREGVVGRARRVATAAGGILGLNRISDAEHQVLDELESALSD